VPNDAWGDAEVFAEIGRYPLRAGCASLSWRAALEALDGSQLWVRVIHSSGSSSSPKPNFS
jgi:hypothetical protein